MGDYYLDQHRKRIGMKCFNKRTDSIGTVENVKLIESPDPKRSWTTDIVYVIALEDGSIEESNWCGDDLGWKIATHQLVFHKYDGEGPDLKIPYEDWDKCLEDCEWYQQYKAGQPPNARISPIPFAECGLAWEIGQFRKFECIHADDILTGMLES